MLGSLLLFDVSTESSCIDFILNMVWIDAFWNDCNCRRQSFDNFVGENMGSGIYFLISSVELHKYTMLTLGSGRGGMMQFFMN